MNIDMTAYQPTQEDIDWMKTVLALLKEGSTWAWPNADATFRVSHKNKTVTMTSPSPNPLFDGENKSRLKAVLKVMGWSFQRESC